MLRLVYGGYDAVHEHPYEMFRQKGVSDYTLLLVKSPGYFYLNGVRTITAPQMAVLYPPHTMVRYGSDGMAYKDDWVHFETVGKETILDEIRLPFQTPMYVPEMAPLSGCLRLLVRKRRRGGLYEAETEDALLRSLLYSLAALVREAPDRRREKRYFREMQELRVEIYNTPENRWDVPRMAGHLHLSESYFQHLYREFFGVSCFRDVIEARMERARFLLSTTDMTVGMLAEVCGYESELHFMRQFRQKTGMTPTEYRRFASGSDEYGVQKTKDRAVTKYEQGTVGSAFSDHGGREDFSGWKKGN